MLNFDQGGRAREQAKILPPPPDLVDLVESMFIVHDVEVASADAGRGASWRIVPDPSANIIIALPRTRTGAPARAVVVGARSTFADIDVSRRQTTLGIRLRPGALSILAREKATAFTDNGFAIDDLLGPSWRGFRERWSESESRDPVLVLRDAVDLLRQTASTRRASSRKLMAAAKEASSVTAMARALSMPVRTLNERTHEVIGLSPKRLLRILRLYRALEMQGSQPESWASIATSTGFADQAHLVREVRDLLGETPREWGARGRPKATANETERASAA